jgi:PAS domain S-box-containing protein
MSQKAERDLPVTASDRARSVRPSVPLDVRSFEHIASNAPVMIWACDAQGGFTFFNTQWEVFTGIARENLLANPWMLDVHTDDHHTSRQRFLSAFQERVSYQTEYRLRRCDGRYRWLLDAGVPTFDERGSFMGYVGNCVDITDRKIMEDALTQSERKFKLLFELSADAQLLIDGERVVDCNSAAVTLFQRADRWAIIGRGISDLLVNTAHVGAPLRELLKIAIDHSSHRFEHVALRTSGSELPVEVLLTGIPMSGRVFVHAVLRDLSRRRELERIVAQTHKMEAIGTLAGGIAHDFNNLLAAIMGYAELALLELPTEAHSNAAGSLREALIATRRARDLVRHILVFSRQDDVRHVELDLARVVAESARLLKASMPSVEMRFHTERGCFVRGNATQLQQVIINLGVNAEHAMRPKGGGVLELTLTRDAVSNDVASAVPGAPLGPVVRLKVRDTGIGMSEHVRERVFDPFYTTKPVGEGTGMGLSVAHGIVTSHHGTISIESEAGVGTTFTLTFPASDEGSTHDTSPRRASVPVSGSGTVLVVEDDASVGKVVHRLLTHVGYHVVLCDDPAEALARFTNEPSSFDAVITDQLMPGMTGDVLAAELLKVRPDVPVVIATACDPTPLEERFRALGVRAVLRKPVTATEFTNALRSVTVTRTTTQSQPAGASGDTSEAEAEASHDVS